MYHGGFHYPGEPLPPPRDPIPPAQQLVQLIATKDVRRVRAFLDEAFWSGQPVKPEFSHLSQVLLNDRENIAMLRLLVTWGAAPVDENLRNLYIAVGENSYPECTRLLRRCGLRLPSSVMNKPPGFETIPPRLEIPENQSEQEKPFARISNGSPPLYDSRVTLLSEEWRKTLKAFQDQGAGEAVIAGGALRDFYAKRAVKDVDIFLASRGSEGKNKKFLKNAFEAAGLKIREQYIGGSDFRKIPAPASSKDFQPAQQDYWSGKQIPASALESWTIVAGPQKTEYNIIFVNGPLGERLAKKNTLALLDAFDIDLCQIATNGVDLISTPAYREGVRRKRITMRNEKETSRDHLQRLVKKYPDFELCAASKRILEAPPPRPTPPPSRVVRY
jgi:hypothetical protein